MRKCPNGCVCPLLSGSSVFLMIVKCNDSVMVLHTDVKILLKIEHFCIFRDQNAILSGFAFKMNGNLGTS